MKNKIRKIFQNEDFKEILVKGFSFLMIRSGGLLAGYVYTYLIAKHYGAASNGLIALSFTLLLCVGVIGRLGIDMNIVRYFAMPKNWLKNGLFYRLMLISFFSSSFFAWLLYYFREVFVYKIFDKPQIEPYIIWVVLTIPLWTVVLICGGLFRAKKMNLWFAILDNPGRFLLSLIILLSFLFISEDELLPIKAHFTAVLLLAGIAFIKVKRVISPVTIISSSNTTKFIKDSFPMMISGAILIFLGWADTFVLGIYESDTTVGVYNVSLKIAALTGFTLIAINSILAPKIAFSYQNNSDYKKLIQFSTKLNFIITLIVLAFILGFKTGILGFFGEEFLAGTNIVIILCVGQLINSISGSVGIILQMTGNQRVYQNIVLIALLINIILNFALTPKHGAIGAAIATVISISFWNVIGAIYLKRKLNIISYFSINKI